MNVLAILFRALFVVMAFTGGAAGAEDFYKDKTLTIGVGIPPGGVYDIYARLFARHLADFIPGKPVLIVQNMPGAAGVRVANFVYNVAPKDGTYLGMSLPNIPLNEFLSPEGVKYHSEKFIWIGRGDAPAQVLFTWTAFGIRTVDDARKREVLTGSTAPDSAQPMTMYPLLANALLGTRFKLISGYQGGADVDLALERGEIQAVGSNSWLNIEVTKPEWIRDAKITPLFQMTFKRDPTLPPDTPTFLELVDNNRDRDIARLLTRVGAVGLYLMAPPGVPSDRVEILRKAFAEMVASPAFIADAKVLGMGDDPMSGADLQKLVTDILATPPDIVADFMKAAVPTH